MAQHSTHLCLAQLLVVAGQEDGGGVGDGGHGERQRHHQRGQGIAQQAGAQHQPKGVQGCAPQAPLRRPAQDEPCSAGLRRDARKPEGADL